MPCCSNCGESFSGDRAVCPDCFRPLIDNADFASDDGAQPSARDADSYEDQTDALLPIARFNNAAEAGYFAHELLRNENIPASVTMSENFDALSGYWSTRFVLSVSEPLVETATICLQELISQSDTDDIPLETDFSDDDLAQPLEYGNEYDSLIDRPMESIAEEESGVNWVPIVLTLAAGSAVFWGVRTMNAKPRPEAAAAGREEQADLWNRLTTPSGKWVQPTEDGRGRRELLFDARRRNGVLREDLDGDGRFETVIPFGPAVPNR